MYIGRKYLPPNEKAVRQFINKYSFATLTGVAEGQLLAVHIPIEMENDNQYEYLVGHVARGNEIKSCFDGSQEMMAVFMEPHTYISSSWYDFPEVPTWNYIAVHAYGVCETLSEEETRKSLYDLVDRYEGTDPKRFKMDQLDEKYISAQVRGVVGFKMKISKLEARFKLSQNRDYKNFRNVIQRLNDRGDAMSKIIAEEMEKIRNAQ